MLKFKLSFFLSFFLYVIVNVNFRYMKNVTLCIFFVLLFIGCREEKVDTEQIWLEDVILRAVDSECQTSVSWLNVFESEVESFYHTVLNPELDYCSCDQNAIQNVMTSFNVNSGYFSDTSMHFEGFSLTEYQKLLELSNCDNSNSTNSIGFNFVLDSLFSLGVISFDTKKLCENFLYDIEHNFDNIDYCDYLEKGQEINDPLEKVVFLEPVLWVRATVTSLGEPGGLPNSDNPEAAIPHVVAGGVGAWFGAMEMIYDTVITEGESGLSDPKYGKRLLNRMFWTGSSAATLAW